MFKKFEKIKNLIGYNNESEQVEATVEPKREPTIDTTTTKDVKKCDCCGEQDVTIEITEMFKIDENGVNIPLFEHPKVNLHNGSVYDDVVICDECFSSCETDMQKQYVWIVGKMNSLYGEVVAKEETINANNQLMEQIRLEAEAKMNKIAEESNILSSEIHKIQNDIELYAQEQAQLEGQL